MKKSIIALSLACLAVPYSFADQYQVTKAGFKPSKEFIVDDFKLQPDGAVYALRQNLQTRNTYIVKQSLSGKFTSLGNIPHPDIEELNNDAVNPITIAASSSGTVVAAYPFYNENKKYQIVFYQYKGGKWTRLTDLLDKDTNIKVKQMFVNNDGDVVFYSDLYNRFYYLQSGSSDWKLINTLASDPKTEIHHENIFSVDNDGGIYSTSKDVKSNSFSVNKYNQDSIDYSTPIDLSDGKYIPACTTRVGDKKVITAFMNNKDNLVNKSVKFELIDLSNHGEKSIVDNGSLIGSLFSLGKATVNLVSGGSKDSSESANSNSQSMQIKEVDLKGYKLTDYVQCTTVGNNSYFIIRAYNNNGIGFQYLYYKISQ